MVALRADWTEVRPGLAAVLLREGPWPVYLHSDPGTGKSCAAGLMFASWPKGREPLWIDVSRFLTAAMAGRADRSVGTTRQRWGAWWEIPDEADAANLHVGEAWVLSRISRSGLVVFDDIGVRNPSDAKRELFLEMLNLRGNEPLVVTGNLPPEQLEETFDARTASRLLSGRVVRVKGEDRRWANAQLLEA